MPYAAARYFAPRYWPARYFAGSAPYPDLLSALIALLRSAPSLAAPFGRGFGAGGFGQLGFGGGVQVYDAEADAGAYPPFLIVDGYREVLPGETADDGTVEATVVVVTNGLDEARAAGAAVKALIDPPNVNPASLGRDPFAWQAGTETVALRDASTPYRLPGLGKGGRYVWAEEVVYTFWVSPSV